LRPRLCENPEYAIIWPCFGGALWDVSLKPQTVTNQTSFLPARLEDYVAPDNPVRVIDAFVDELDLAALGFARVQPAATGRPGYAPGTMLKLYVYGYLHQLT
jgi:transposase